MTRRARMSVSKGGRSVNDPMMRPCRRGCGELVHLENDGFHVCRPKAPSPILTASEARDAAMSVTGFVVEVGNIGMGLRHAESGNRGVIIECGDRYIELRGLDKAEGKALAKLLTKEVVLRISPCTALADKLEAIAEEPAPVGRNSE